MHRALLLIFLFVVIANSVLAQGTLSSKNKKAIELYRQADNYRVRGQYQEAASLLIKAIERDKSFDEAYFRLALVYKATRSYSKSSEVLLSGLEVTSDLRKRRAYYFELGENYLRLGNYDESLRWLNEYLAAESLNKSRIEQAERWKANAEYALANKPISTQLEAKPLSDSVNAFKMQYFPVLTANEQRLIFTRRMGVTDQYDEDLVISTRRADGTWSKPVSLSDQINSEYNEGTCTISADGRKLIFTSCMGRKGYGNCDLFVSEKVGDRWSIPVNLGAEVNSAAWESQPSLSADGRTLYFVSDRKGGVGNRDLYSSSLQDDGTWTKAKNLGDTINTPYDEISPFIHANGRALYFTSNGRPGYGGYDIYRAERNRGKWSEPTNLGAPVNTFEDQFSFFITADGERGYYAHEENFRKDGTKIYEVQIPESLREKYRGNVVMGKVSDQQTGKPLKATVELFDLSNQEMISRVTSDSVTGEYVTVLSDGAEFALYVNAEQYMFRSLNFDYQQRSEDAPVTIDIALEPVSSGAAVVLNNIFFDTDKYDLKDKSITELNKVVRFLNSNPSVVIEIGGHTDDVGNKDYNLQLSLRRANAVKEFLVSKGINPTRLLQKGYGDTRPIRPNNSDLDRSFNRRIEIRVIR